MLIRSQKTGVPLPRQGIFVRGIDNLGRKLILVDFGSAGEEYLFPHEVLDDTPQRLNVLSKQSQKREPNER